MDVVVDTNVLMASLLKDSTNRKLLSNKNFNFYIPEFSIQEIEKYKDYLINKSELSKEEFEELFELIIENINIIPFEEIKPYMDKAKEIMKDIDIKDSNFIACALYLKCGIFSYDEHFKKQNIIKIYNIQELL